MLFQLGLKANCLHPDSGLMCNLGSTKDQPDTCKVGSLYSPKAAMEAGVSDFEQGRGDTSVPEPTRASQRASTMHYNSESPRGRA